MRHVVVAAVTLPLLAAVAFVVGRGRSASAREAEAAAALAAPAPPEASMPDNPTLDLREQVLTRAMLSGMESGNRDSVRCVVMDWNLGGGNVATLVSFDDGTTSLYYSTGGGVIGAGSHAEVQRAAGQWRTQAAALRAGYAPASAFPMPPDDTQVFHLVTEGATLSTRPIPVDELKAGTHAFSAVANRAQEVIYRVRTAKG